MDVFALEIKCGIHDGATEVATKHGSPQIQQYPPPSITPLFLAFYSSSLPTAMLTMPKNNLHSSKLCKQSISNPQHDKWVNTYCWLVTKFDVAVVADPKRYRCVRTVLLLLPFEPITLLKKVDAFGVQLHVGAGHDPVHIFRRLAGLVVINIPAVLVGQLAAQSAQ
jgi:hypothetical protein